MIMLRYTYTAVVYFRRLPDSLTAHEMCRDIGSLSDIERLVDQNMPDDDASHVDIWRDDPLAMTSRLIEQAVPNDGHWEWHKVAYATH